MDAIDQSVLSFLVDLRSDWLTGFMLIITYLGSYMIVGWLTLLSAGSFYIHKHISKILPLFIAVGGSAATVYVLKSLFFKARPLVQLYVDTDSSFPSGHATMAMAFYGFLIYSIYKNDKHHLKNPFIILLGLIILLVGISRLYLGMHHLSDVLAGYTIGFIWICLGIHLSRLSPLRRFLKA